MMTACVVNHFPLSVTGRVLVCVCVCVCYRGHEGLPFVLSGLEDTQLT